MDSRSSSRNSTLVLKVFRLWEILIRRPHESESRDSAADRGRKIQEEEFRAAQRRILEEAERQRGTPEGGRHRWHDGPTRPLPLAQHRTPLPTYGQQRGYRCRG
jgi:hypothetical protein